MSEKLSENFTRAEFACPTSGLCRVSNRLLGALESLRKLSGDRRIFVTRGGGCRSWGYNQQLVQAKGASKKSEHLIQDQESWKAAKGATRECRAADIHIEGLAVPEMYWLALSVPDFNREGGIGVYPQNGFIHVDVRGHAARWMWVDGEQKAIPPGFEQDPGVTFGVEEVSDWPGAMVDVTPRLLMAEALVRNGLAEIAGAIEQLKTGET